MDVRNFSMHILIRFNYRSFLHPCLGGRIFFILPLDRSFEFCILMKNKIKQETLKSNAYSPLKQAVGYF